MKDEFLTNSLVVHMEGKIAGDYSYEEKKGELLTSASYTDYLSFCVYIYTNMIV
jgi:hypothetical protein